MDSKDKKAGFLLGSDYNGFLERYDFFSLLIAVCKEITNGTYKDDKGNSTLEKWLYFMLNCKPKADLFKQGYDDMISQYGMSALRQHIDKRLFVDEKELAVLYPLIEKLPIKYGSPEIDIAKMHFDGSIGLDRKKPEDYKDKLSPITLGFDFSSYKRIRAASTHRELVEVESHETKIALLHILTGYYIDWYARLLTRIINSAGFGIRIKDAINPQERLESIIVGLKTRDVLDVLSQTTAQTVDTNIKRDYLKGHCDKKVLNDTIKLLNKIGVEFHIRSKACSKKEFAQIAWVIKEYCRVLNFNKYQPCRNTLAHFYGIDVPTYKIKDGADYLKTKNGRKLRNMIDEFCAEHEDYCKKKEYQ